MARTWGKWTEVKLDALSSYLHGFTTASKSARGTLYLDLFAGTPENYLRDDRRRLVGSAARALEVQPRLSKMIFCELEPGASQLRTSLTESYPDRVGDFEVVPGDCNVTMPRVLSRLDSGWRFAPAFAFIDQYSAEVRWETISSLARFKNADRNKVELWLFFGDGLIPRGAHTRGDEPAHPEFLERVDRMFGTTQWRELKRGRDEGLLEGHQLRSELVNLMRWRLEHDLGYATTLPLEVCNSRGAPIYTMIFATDHPAGDRIMKYILGNAERELREMRRRAKLRRLDEREEEDGVASLFTAESLYAPDEPEDVREPSLGPALRPWRYPET